ncbi:MAG: ATP-binding cassette domain-containing protein [Bacteroidetes bacterium]|nr:ATP-binding cassette domain-containing protein [Bacteroidota bacterium]
MNELNSDILVKAKGIGKKYSYQSKRANNEDAMAIIRSVLGKKEQRNDSALGRDEFWALRDISFELKRGEAVGIVGLNGAGKSTLLKVLLGMLECDEGIYEVNGKVGGLIELGAGFNSDVSGLKNIYQNAAYLGYSKKQADEKLEAIIEFADIGRFINSPTKTYSSGMNIRLGFAIAIHFIPDLVLCDEILAVGDFEFRQKCLHKIKELRATRSFVLVSHSARDISMFCDSAILLHKGHLIIQSDPDTVLKVFSYCSNNKTVSEVMERANKVLSLGEKKKITNKKVVMPAVMPQIKGLGGVRQFSRKNQLLETVSDYDLEKKNSLFKPEYHDPAACGNTNCDRKENYFSLRSSGRVFLPRPHHHCSTVKNAMNRPFCRSISNGSLVWKWSELPSFFLHQSASIFNVLVYR